MAKSDLERLRERGVPNGEAWVNQIVNALEEKVAAGFQKWKPDVTSRAFTATSGSGNALSINVRQQQGAAALTAYRVVTVHALKAAIGDKSQPGFQYRLDAFDDADLAPGADVRRVFSPAPPALGVLSCAAYLTSHQHLALLFESQELALLLPRPAIAERLTAFYNLVA